MKNSFGRYFVTLCTALVVGLAAFGYWMATFSDATATEGDETVDHTIEAPLSGTGYTVSELLFSSVFSGGSYTFTITSLSDSHSPNVTLNTIYGLLQFTGRSGNDFSYQVSNVLGSISASDFTVTMSLNKYTVRFCADGRDWINPVQDIEHGSTISEPTGVDKQWHIFEGWYNGNDDTKWVFANPITADITLYAKFRPYRFNIIFLDEGKDTFSGTYVGALVHEYGKPTRLPNLTRDGYSSDCPYPNGETVGDGYISPFFLPQVLDGLIYDGMTINFYVRWIPENYNITYKNVNGSSFGFHSSLFASVLPTSYTIESPRIVFPFNDISDQYRFLGWYLDAAGTQPIVSIETGSFGNKTIYAKWEEHTFEINRMGIDPDNPTMVDSECVITYSELPFVLEALPDTDNWNFGFWLFENDVVVTGQTLVYNNFTNNKITVKAHWIGKELNVTFTTDTNKGYFSGNQSTRTTVVNYGSYVFEILPTPVQGWIFVRWMNNSQPFNPITDKVTGAYNLVAEWKLDTSALVSIIERLDNINLEDYSDLSGEKLGALLDLIAIASRIISESVYSDGIENRPATPADVASLISQLNEAIDELMGEQIEALAKAEALYHLELLKQDVLAYKNHSNYNDWNSELSGFAANIKDIFDNLANYDSVQIKAIIKEILDFFNGKPNVEMINDGGYERPEEPFTYADLNLIQQLTTLISNLEPYGNESKDLLTDLLFNYYQQRVAVANNYLNTTRVTNSQLQDSIAQLTQLQNWINAHIASMAGEKLRTDIAGLIKELNNNYVGNAQLWQKIGTTLKSNLESLIANAKNDLLDIQLLKSEAELILLDLNSVKTQLDTLLAAKIAKDQASAALQTLVEQVETYIATSMMQGLNKVKLTSAVNNAKSVLANSNSETYDFVDARVALQTAYASAKKPSNSPNDENAFDMVWLIVVAILAAFVSVLLFTSYPSLRKIKDYKKEPKEPKAPKAQKEPKMQKEEKS